MHRFGRLLKSWDRVASWQVICDEDRVEKQELVFYGLLLTVIKVQENVFGCSNLKMLAKMFKVKGFFDLTPK